MDEFRQLASQPDLDCLLKTQETEVVALPQAAKVCGNYILEPPEQCDCGPAEVSQKLSQLSNTCSVFT